MNYFSQLTQQLRQVWQGMSPGRRIAMVLILIIGVATVLGIGYWASQPDYRVAFSGLAAEDASAITNKLQASSVPYKLDAGGTSILVPADKLQQVKIELAADGLPSKGGAGFEMFDKSSFGMTPFAQQVNYLRALQAELARTIMQIDPIVYARVHIVRPDPTPFLREKKPTTVSVMVRLKPGATLSRNAAASVVALVSRSVEGLGRENVTIVDTHGRLLSEDINPETGMIGSHLEYRRELESYLSSRAEQMLAQVVGPGRALVRVTADLNFQKHKEKKETYSPEGKVASKEMITSSKTAGAAPKGGAPGTASNTGKGGSGPGGGGTTAEETVQTDYVISKITQETEEKFGGIDRLTIAALVDLSPSDKDAKDAAPSLKLADAEEIIKQAVGYKTGRDEIKVTGAQLKVPEEPANADEHLESVQQWQNILNLVRYASLGLAALAALGIGWMVLRRGKPTSPEPAQNAPGKAAERDPLVESLSSAAEQNPEALVRVLEAWLEKSEQPRRMAA
ncbi:MAG: flagellar basal-body MS-ring/collar protein FliF [Gemmataceae bacterium]